MGTDMVVLLREAFDEILPELGDVLRRSELACDERSPALPRACLAVRRRSSVARGRDVEDVARLDDGTAVILTRWPVGGPELSARDFRERFAEQLSEHEDARGVLVLPCNLFEEAARAESYEALVAAFEEAGRWITSPPPERPSSLRVRGESRRSSDHDL